MFTEEVKIDLSEIQLKEAEIRRESDRADEIEFSIKGQVSDIETQKIEDVMLSNEMKPISITLQIEPSEFGE